MLTNVSARTLGRPCLSRSAPALQQRPAPVRKVVCPAQNQPGDMKPQTDHPVQDSLKDAGQTLKKAYTQVTQGAAQSLNKAGDKVMAQSGKAADNLSGTAEEVKQKASDFGSDVQDPAKGAGRNIQEAGNNARDAARDVTDSAKDAARKAENDAKASAGVTTSNIKDITKSIDRLTANAPDDIKSQANINKLYGDDGVVAVPGEGITEEVDGLTDAVRGSKDSI